MPIGGPRNENKRVARFTHCCTIKVAREEGADLAAATTMYGEDPMFQLNSIAVTFALVAIPTGIVTFGIWALATSVGL